MSFADIRIVAIALILSITYGTFLVMNAEETSTVFEVGNPTFDNMGTEQRYDDSVKHGDINSTDYDKPNAFNLMDTLNKIGQMNMDHPELFFINSILFGTIAFLLVFIGLRFLRGTG